MKIMNEEEFCRSAFQGFLENLGYKDARLSLLDPLMILES